MEEITPEYLAQAKAGDERLRRIDLGIEVEAGLREGGVLRALVDHFRADVWEVMDEFVEANPADFQAIARLQARVYRATRTVQALNEIMLAGQVAESNYRRGED